MSEDDRAFATRLARYGARNPVALERLTHDRSAKAVTHRSDKADGPTAGTETADPLEFLARVRVHLPDKGHVTTRYDGWYANRPRGMRRQAEPAPGVPLPSGDVWRAQPSHRGVIVGAAGPSHPRGPPLVRHARRPDERQGTPPPLTRCQRDRRSRRTFDELSTDPD